MTQHNTPQRKSRHKKSNDFVLPIEPDESEDTSDDNIPEELPNFGSVDMPIPPECISEYFIDFGIFALNSLDSIYICPVSELPPSLMSLNSNRKYEVLDYHGTRLFYAAEHHSCPNRVFCSESRSFVMELYDLSGTSFLTISRPFSCSLCLCGTDCFLNCCNETTANDQTSYYGKIRTFPNFQRPIFILEDELGNKIFSIIGPSWSYWLICKLCCVTQFLICIPDSDIRLGKIQRGYDGLDDENVPNPNTVSVIFPPNCTPQIKACLMAAGFMMDVTYFEKRGRTCCRFFRRILIILAIFSIIGASIYTLFFNRFFEYRR